MSHPVPAEGGTVLEQEIFGLSRDDDFDSERDLLARREPVSSRRTAVSLTEEWPSRINITRARGVGRKTAPPDSIRAPTRELVV
jgi:hypothetical protein